MKQHYDYPLLTILSLLQFITTGVGTTTVLRSLSSYQMLAGVLGTKLEYIHQPRKGEDPERYPHLVFFLSAMYYLGEIAAQDIDSSFKIRNTLAMESANYF